MKNRFYSYQIGIKWVKINGTAIKYTNHLDRASFLDSKKKALTWKKAISDKYPLAELVELKLSPVN